MNRRRRIDDGALVAPVGLDIARVAFTPSMAIREGSVFAGAPIVQGDWDGTGTPDVLSFSRGAQIADLFYASFDPYQGGGFCEWTPEQSSGEQPTSSYLWYVSADYYLRYEHTAARYGLKVGGQSLTVSATLVAGTSEILAWGYDTRNDLDGTNYAYLSRANVQTFGMAVQPTASAPDATLYVGSYAGTIRQLNGIIEGLVFVREIPWTGAYGTDMGLGDVVAAHYAAGAGADIAETIGAWGTTFSLPTSSTVGPLVTGLGHAHSMSHAANVLEEPWATDGYGPDQANVLEFDGVGDYVDCGSAVALDDLPDGADATFECYARWVSGNRYLLSKGTATTSGWSILSGVTGQLAAYMNFDNTNISLIAATAFTDGKWHHLAIDWDWGTLTAEAYVDGVSVSTDTAVGNYVSDAALSVRMGSSPTGTSGWTGDIAWVRLSNNRRYTADFIPPRTMPAADGNTVEQWSMEDGTGATVVASVTTPGNDGTITGATWTVKWDAEGTPVQLQGVEYNATTTNCQVADAAPIRDLHDAAATWETWFRCDGKGEGNYGVLMQKGTLGVSGWTIYNNNATHIRVQIPAATTAASVFWPFVPDRRAHHLAVQFDDGGDRKLYGWLDGIPLSTSGAAVGAVITDNTLPLGLGNRTAGDRTWDGALFGWSRLSNILRYTNGKAFVPSPPTTAPGVDVNTAWQSDFSDGAGAVLTDDSAGANNGALTNHTWVNSRDLADLQGEQNYQWGYVTGSDGANEGITQTQVGLAAGENYAVRTNLTPSADGTARMFIRVRDETNGATIKDFYGPRYVGTHTGANGSAALTDAGARWMQALVGAMVYNITDGSSTTITAVSGDGTTITGILAGGTDDDWDTGDTYRIVWPYQSGYGGFADHPWVEEFAFELPTTGRNMVAADCVSISAKAMNAAATGTVFFQQLEVYPNLVDNPSFEAEDHATADSRVLNTGTEDTALSNADVLDGTNYQISEVAGAPGFDVELTMNHGFASMDRFRLYGYYGGNAAHVVNVDVWNYTTTAWVTLGQLPDAVADAYYDFDIDNADYVSGGVSQIRIQHTSAGNVNHDLFIDYMYVTGYADPWIPDGWAVAGGLAAGESIQGATVHSGNASFECVVTNGGVYYATISSAAGAFLCIGGWQYVTAGTGRQMMTVGQASAQRALATQLNLDVAAAAWTHRTGVVRALQASLWFYARRALLGSGSHDDVYALALTAVSLTATPASEANSAESGGLRDDGRDQATQSLLGQFGATAGWRQFRVLPRHNPANLIAFAEADEAVMWHLEFAGGGYIEVRSRLADQLTIAQDFGGGEEAVNYNAAAAWVANQNLLIDVQYGNYGMRLLIDGAIVAAGGTGPVFDVSAIDEYLGSDENGANQMGGVFANP